MCIFGNVWTAVIEGVRDLYSAAQDWHGRYSAHSNYLSRSEFRRGLFVVLIPLQNWSPCQSRRSLDDFHIFFGIPRSSKISLTLHQAVSAQVLWRIFKPQVSPKFSKSWWHCLAHKGQVVMPTFHCYSNRQVDSLWCNLGFRSLIPYHFGSPSHGTGRAEGAEGAEAEGDEADEAAKSEITWVKVWMKADASKMSWLPETGEFWSPKP